MSEIKFRSVCEACTSAKVRCNGKTPCERCLKKGVECLYIPFKNRGGQTESAASSSTAVASSAKAALNTSNKVAANKVATPSSENVFKTHKLNREHVSKQGKASEFQDMGMLDEYEKKTWSVFFTLYKSFGKGCSLFWFKQQLFKMLNFLQVRSAQDSSLANALVRLKSWMTALGIDTSAPPCLNLPNKAFPHFKFEAPAGNKSTSNVSLAMQVTMDELLSEATRRNLPTLRVGKDEVVEVNDSFLRTFNITSTELKQVLDDSAGGFLPWCGDLMARLLAREADLILYLQGVGNNLDAIGRPSTIPCTQYIPSMNVLHVNRIEPLSKQKTSVLSIVRAVQILHVDSSEEFHYASLIVFDIPEDSPHVPTKARVFEESTIAQDKEPDIVFSDTVDEEADTAKRVQTGTSFDEDMLAIPAFPSDMFDTGDLNDEHWLDNLLTWAGDDETNQQAMSSLPIADEMFSMNLASQE